MEERRINRTHRVGTLTSGGMLILFGTLFLIHIFVPALQYRFIFRLWPLIFIFLGIEILIGNFRSERLQRQEETVNFLYDKPAILLTFCLTFFAMLIAAVDFCIQQGDMYVQF